MTGTWMRQVQVPSRRKDSKGGSNHEFIAPRLFRPRCKRPAVGGLQRSRHSVAAVVRGGSLSDCDALLCSSADTAVGAAHLECRLCGDQPVPILAPLPRASSSQTDA